MYVEIRLRVHWARAGSRRRFNSIQTCCCL